MSWATVSEMPLEQMGSAWAQQGWTIPYASSDGITFSADLGAGGGFLLDVFLREGDAAYLRVRRHTPGRCDCVSDWSRCCKS